jgi:HEAT repeat protein
VAIKPDPRLQQAAARPENDPLAPESARPRRWFAIIAIVAGALGGALFMGTGTARAAWDELAQLLSLHGKPEPASANVLSEHEAEQLRSLFMTALNSDDLRVRAAAIEIDLASRNVEKAAAAIDRMEHDARFGEQGPRANALWDIALLGNRGIEPGRAAEILLASIHDSNVNIRYWAVEGLAYLGTDETIAPLLQTFHDDASPMIRERAACGLAQSGMLSEKQRRSAVPQLLDFADDTSLDPETHKWVFQALRDITGQTLPHDAASWRAWYNSNDGHGAPVTRDSQ